MPFADSNGSTNPAKILMQARNKYTKADQTFQWKREPKVLSPAVRPLRFVVQSNEERMLLLTCWQKEIPPPGQLNQQPNFQKGTCRRPQMADPQERIGQQIGNYHLVRLLGRGGFADVYLGQHVHISSKQAAIKILHLFDVDTQQFRQEAEITEKLRHPHIVRLLDFGVLEEETPFLVLDYAPGGSLRARHPKGSQVPLATVTQYLTELASALQYAHDQNILHRDIKPDNILIGPHGELLLSDFGIASLSRVGKTSVQGNIVGTPDYMAPEQFRGDSKKASDQYAVATVVYEWLSGTVPFSKGDFFQLGYQHVHEPVPPLRASLPTLPVPVERVVLTALSKRPEGRFASVQDFAVELQEASQPTVLSPRTASTSLSVSPSSLESTVLSPASEPVVSTSKDESRFASTDPAQLAKTPEIPSTLLVTSSYPSFIATIEERQRVLQKIRTKWIEGVLSHSPHQAVIERLGLSRQTAEVLPRNLVRESDGSHFESDTPIIDLYDQAHGSLLIAGALGAGKTTLLLELLRDLLVRAESDQRRPLPLVCSLVSWTGTPNSIEAWLIKVLQTQYQVPQELVVQWIKNDQIHPLFDGLDDVLQREACVDALVDYWREHLSIPILVCSQAVELLVQQRNIPFRDVIHIEPFTHEQVKKYLGNAGASFQALRTVLSQGSRLQMLATAPLNLSMLLLLSHQHQDVRDLQMLAPSIRQDHLYSLYASSMLQAPDTRTLQQGQQRLSELARFLQEHKQNAFSFEKRLPSPYQSSSAQMRGTRYVFGVILCATSLLLCSMCGVFSGNAETVFLIVLGCCTVVGGMLAWWVGTRSSSDNARPQEALEAWYKGYTFPSEWKEDYSRFLDQAVERHLLRKVGNGYQFLHPLFRDYFARQSGTASDNF